MQIKLWSNFSKRSNSTKRPNDADAVVKDVRLKDNTSIESPTFLVSGNYTTDYNYAQAFGHYYFINDIVQVTNGVYQLSCSQDVLATWKDEILSSTQYVARSQSNYDGSIIDNMYPIKNDLTIVQSKQYFRSDVTDDIITYGSYVIGIINNSSSSIGVVSYYVLTPSQFADFKAKLFDENTFSSEEIQKELFNPFQYVVSCKWFRKVDAYGSDVSSIPYGWWTLSGVSAKKLGQDPRHIVKSESVSIPVHPQVSTYGSYVRTSPYSNYMFIAEPFGTIPLEPTEIAKCDSIKTEMTVDYVSGEAILYILGVQGTTEYILNRSIANISADIQISQMLQDRVGGVVNTISNGIGALLGGALVGGFSIANNIGSVANSLIPKLNTQGSNSGLNHTPVDFIIQGTFYYVVNRGDSEKGRPLMREVTLSSLQGFVQCSDASVSLPCLGNDRDTVNSMLNSGIFIE